MGLLLDGIMGQERAGMASTGQGSGGDARQRESGDAKTVADAGERGGYGEVGGGIAGGAAGSTGGGQPSGAGSQGQAGSQSSSGSEPGAGGGEQESGESGGGDTDGSEQQDARVAKIPEDIPADGSADDQVARQIREAAIAEQDPMIRDALWDEYRKHMGIKK